MRLSDNTDTNQGGNKRLSPFTMVAGSILILLAIVIGTIVYVIGRNDPEKLLANDEATSLMAAASLEAKENANDNLKFVNENSEEAGNAEASGEAKDLVFPESEVTASPSFYNYTTKNGVLIQVIFVRSADKSLRVGLNTSEESKGEPDAYFIPGEGILRCAHTGHVAAFGEVGLGTSDSAPVGIKYTVTDGNILIEASELAKYEDYFINWNGPIE